MFPGLLNSLADTSQDFQAGADRFIPSLLDAPQTILAKMAQWEVGSASPGLGYQAAKGVATPGTVRTTGWHGSPHKFTKPDISKVGTGEGAQAYGYGFYAAEGKRTGEIYREGLSRGESGIRYEGEVIPTPTQFVNSRPLESLIDNVESAPGYYKNKAVNQVSLYGKDGAMAQAKLDLEGVHRNEDFFRKNGRFGEFQANAIEYIKAVRRVDESKIERFDPGYLYKMDIPDTDVEKMLDYDAPLGEQSESVMGLLGIAPETRKKDMLEKYVNESVKAGGNEEELRKAVETILYENEVDAAAWKIIRKNPEPFDPNTLHDVRYDVVQNHDVDIAEILHSAALAEDVGKEFPGVSASLNKNDYFNRMVEDGGDLLENLEHALGGPEAAANYFKSIGVPGIKYWDQGSRGAGEGTRNFVIFDPERIKMLERNEQQIEGLL